MIIQGFNTMWLINLNFPRWRYDSFTVEKRKDGSVVYRWTGAPAKAATKALIDYFVQNGGHVLPSPSGVLALVAPPDAFNA